jgi:hypothetical protein
MSGGGDDGSDSVTTGWAGADGTGTATCLLWQAVSTDPRALASSSAPRDRANTEPKVLSRSGRRRCEDLTLVTHHCRKAQSEGCALSRLAEKVDCTTVKLDHPESGG